VFLHQQEFELQLEQPIAGEAGATAGNSVSVMEFPRSRKLDESAYDSPAMSRTLGES
jgi:hypothetical protein